MQTRSWKKTLCRHRGSSHPCKSFIQSTITVNTHTYFETNNFDVLSCVHFAMFGVESPSNHWRTGGQQQSTILSVMPSVWWDPVHLILHHFDPSPLAKQASGVTREASAAFAFYFLLWPSCLYSLLCWRRDVEIIILLLPYPPLFIYLNTYCCCLHFV